MRHKPSIVLSLALAALILAPLHAADSRKPLKVFILAGQSNMQGYGRITTIDALGLDPTYGHLLKKIKNPDGSFVVRDDVFYRRAIDAKKLLSVGCGRDSNFIGPELMFGITMGDYYEEPVLLIKTAWGGHDLYCNFRSPSAGKPAYDVGNRDIGASYRRMVKDVHSCLDTLDVLFPQLKGLKPELCGFVWFHGWNDMIGPQGAYDEYCSNFVHLVQDLRAEFKVPNLLAVVGEMGVGGEVKDANSGMARFRAAQAKIATCPELKGRVGYVRTAPFWYPELDELPKALAKEEARVGQEVDKKLKEEYKGKPLPANMAQIREQAMAKAREADAEYQKVRKQHDLHISNQDCHYMGSSRIYNIVGYSLAEAMKPLLEKK
jgi:alpha-galactosidase